MPSDSSPRAQSSGRAQKPALEDALRAAGVIREHIPRIVQALGTQARNLNEGQKIALLFDDLDGTGRTGQVARLTIYVDDTPSTMIAANDAGSYVSVARVDDGAKVAKKSASDDDEDEDDDEFADDDDDDDDDDDEDDEMHVQDDGHDND